MSHAIKSVGHIFGFGNGTPTLMPVIQANQAKADAAMTPPAPTPPPVNAPDIAAATANVDADEQARADAQLRKKGRAATILTGDQGAGTPKTAAKTLTGE